MSRMTMFSLAVIVTIPLVAVAQTKDSVRSTAKQNAATLRALGEPLDRCSLGANLGPGPVILRTHGASALKAGDKLLALNGTSVADKAPLDVIAILRQTAATNTVTEFQAAKARLLSGSGS